MSFEGYSNLKLLACLIGLLLIVEGTPYFAFPAIMKKCMAVIQETPDNQLRVMGLISMCLGFLIVYILQR
jgi:uncharacterized protein